MALETLQVDILGVYEVFRYRPMGIVAIPAGDFPFPYRVAGLSQQLGPYLFVARGADLDLVPSREIAGIGAMDTVALCA